VRAPTDPPGRGSRCWMPRFRTRCRRTDLQARVRRWRE
jgi:hypothetical protein